MGMTLSNLILIPYGRPTSSFLLNTLSFLSLGGSLQSNTIFPVLLHTIRGNLSTVTM
jgi:hypothetical protein